MTFASIRAQVDALPEPERTARRMLYSDSQWENLWELNAWPHQIPPLGDSWTSWTVIGSRGEGKTVAGYKWLEQKFLYSKAERCLAILSHSKEINRIAEFVRSTLYDMAVIEAFQIKRTQGTSVRFEHKQGAPKTSLFIVSEQSFSEARGYAADYDYIWADEIEDATQIMHQFPLTKQFVFTQPTKLPAETILSRAGASRRI